MPFTLTHVAAVAPLAWSSRGRLPFSALAIGSMVCDIPVFFPHLLEYNSMHSWIGILTHCAPIGLVLYYVFHLLLKRPLATLLPGSMEVRLRRRLGRELDFSPRHLFCVVACIVVGSSTHVVWDAFSHEGRWGVWLLPILGNDAFEVGQKSFHWYEIIQHGSSIVFLPPMIGLATWWVYKQPIAAGDSPRRTIYDIIVLLAFFGVLLAIAAVALSLHDRYPHADWIMVLRGSVRRVGVLMIILGASYCLIINLLYLRNPRNQPNSTGTAT